MSQLITGRNVNAELAKIKRGLGLPRNPAKAQAKVQSMHQNAHSGNAFRTAMSKASEAHRITREGSLQMALEKPRTPMDRFSQANIPH